MFGLGARKSVADAEKLVQQGKLTQAADLYEKLLREQPDNQNIRNILGDLYTRLGRQADAMKLFRQVADSYESSGQGARAIATLKKMLKLEDSTPLQQRLAQLLVAQGAHFEARATLQVLAERAEAAGELSAAASALAQILSFDPDQPRIRLHLAIIREKLGQAEQSRAEFLAVTRQLADSEDPETLAVAVRHLQKAAAEWAPGKMLLAELALHRGDPQEALRLLPSVEELSQLTPDPTQAWQVALGAGDLGKAVELAHGAIALGYRETASALGRELVRSARLDDALAWIRSDDLLFRDPEMAPYWVEVIRAILAEDGQNLAALRLWVELAPTEGHQEARVLLADALAHHENYEEALQILDELLGENPHDAELRASRARVRAKLGIEPDEAERQADELAEKAPEDLAAPPEAAPAGHDFAGADSAAGIPTIPIAPASSDDGSEIELADDWRQELSASTDSQVREIELYLEIQLYGEALTVLRKALAAHPSEPRLLALQRRYQELTGREMGPGLQPEPDADIEEAAVITGAEVEAAGHADVESGSEASSEEISSADTGSDSVVEIEEFAVFAPAHDSSEPIQLDEASIQGDALPANVVEFPMAAAPAAAATARGPENSVGPALIPKAPSAAETPPKGDALEDVFSDFRAQMGAGQTTTDPVVSYNMGIAFYEMGLYEEAIGELQKAFQGMTANRSASDALMRCGSTLAMCFQQAKMPELAIHWYEEILKLVASPSDAVGIRYELAQLFESQGRKEEALAQYRQVYAVNVDYLDVADCLRRVQGGA